MNPAEYAGRSTLSPAWRDRWLGHRQVGPATEKDQFALLLFLVTGESPPLIVEGRSYTGDRRPAPMPALAALLERKPAFRDVLERLASFHVGLEAATQGGESVGLGGRRKERYMFTRRSLLGLMQALERHRSSEPSWFVMALGDALRRYYLDRLAPGDDRTVANNLLDAVDLDPGSFKSSSVRARAEPAPPRAEYAPASSFPPGSLGEKDPSALAASTLLDRLLAKRA